MGSVRPNLVGIDSFNESGSFVSKRQSCGCEVIVELLRLLITDLLVYISGSEEV